MVRLTSFIFCCIFLSGASQTRFIEISGFVYSHPAPHYDKRDTIYIDNVEIVLKIKDSVSMKVLTDKNGRYSIKVPECACFGVLTANAGRYSGRSITYMDGFLSTRETATVNLSGSDLVWNTFVNPVLACGFDFPTFLFKKNEDKPSSAFGLTKITVDSALNYYSHHLNKYFYLMVECIGSADSNEMSAKILSLERARVIKGMLIEKGIEEARISIKGVGTTEPLKIVSIPKGENTLTFQKGELNKRVRLQVTSFDYNVKKRKDLDGNSLLRFPGDGTDEDE